MAKLKESFGIITLSILEILIGILLLINPVGFTSAIIAGMGVLLLLMGALGIFRYFKSTPVEAAKSQSLAQGLGMAIAGLFCVLHSDWFISTFPLLTLLYGVVMLMTSFVRIQWTADALRLKKESWKWMAIGAALSLVLSLLIVFNPFASTNALWVFVSVSLIAEAAADILTVVFTGRAPKQAK